MKTSFIKLTCWALLMAGFASCERDESALKEGGNDNGLTTEGTNYMAFNIVSDGGSNTRAPWPNGEAVEGDFNAGDGTEQAVTSVQGSNVAIFFNKDNSFHSMRDLTRVITPEGGSTPATDRGDGKEVCIGTFVANLKLAEGGTTPDRVLIVLNGNPSRLSALEETVQYHTADYKLPDESEPKNNAEFVLGYLTRKLGDYEINRSNASIVIFSPADVSESGANTEYCTMTNSVYVGTGNLEKDTELSNNIDKGQTGTIYNLVTIGENNIQATEELAKANALTIHVERMAVKVEVDIDDSKMTAKSYGEESGVAGKGLKFPIVIEPAEGNTVLKMGEGGTTVTDATPVPWAFTMLGWSTNAVARRMYLFKNLNDARPDINNAIDSDPHYDVTKNEITTPFFSYWNDPLRARCYWAVDGHYASPKAYPVQYRYSKDNTADNTYKDMAPTGTTSDMPLYYYSFTQMRMLSMGLMPNTNLNDIKEDGSNYSDFLLKGNLRSNLQYRYCGENVLGQNLIKDPNHIWRGASTHVVFFGQLLLGQTEIDDYKKQAEKDKRSTTTLLNLVSDKLYAGGCYWDRAGYMKNAYTTIWRALTSTERDISNLFGVGENFKTPKTVHLYYQKGSEEKKEITSEYLADMADATLNGVHDQFDHTQDDCNGADDTEECIFRLSAANVSNGDGRVMLGLKKDYKLILEGTFESVEGTQTKDITPDDFLSIAYEFAGVADLYVNGRMYYYAPIYHAAAGSAVTGAAPEKVGDIGVVRNHWYKLTISSLLKPGIPVSDPGQPIIPNIDPTDRYLGLEIHVLPWHVISQQVTLQ